MAGDNWCRSGLGPDGQCFVQRFMLFKGPFREVTNRVL